MSDTDPQLGDLAIYTYKYKNDVYTEYVMFRRMPGNLTHRGWFNGQGEEIPASKVQQLQQLPSAAHLHARLDLPDPFAYTPQIGDVALWKASSNSAPCMVTYCQVSDTHDRWYMGGYHFLVSIEVDHTSENFQLLARDGKLVTVEHLAPKPAPERQAVLADYKPKQGDVGTYKTASGALVTVTYRRNDKYPFAEPDWFQANGVQARGAHKDPSFQLILRDGVLQEGATS